MVVDTVFYLKILKNKNTKIILIKNTIGESTVYIPARREFVQIKGREYIVEHVTCRAEEGLVAVTMTDIGPASK